jgi:hypothetical protein
MRPRMKPRLAFSVVVVALALAGTGLAAVPAHAACRLGPPSISLTGFHMLEPRVGYVGAEGESAIVTVAFGGGCGGVTMKVDYRTDSGSAVEGVDFAHTDGTTPLKSVDTEDGVTHPVPVPLSADGLSEGLIESLQFSLSNPQGGGNSPTPGLGRASAPILIVDGDGAARMGFEGMPYSLSETYSFAQIPVFRGGPAGGSASVSYEAVPDPASPATSEDFTSPLSGVINFAPHERMKTIDLGINNDQIGEAPESVILTLSNPSGGGLENPQTRFTIEDNEESVKPSSRFHHPRHGWRYKKSDYRIREFHVFAHDNPGGAGVVGSELALKRTRKNGSCQWFGPGGWQARDCQNRLWVNMKYDSTGELFFFRMKQLKSSVGTNIKNYTAFSRAIDGAGNVENDFNEKRNANTFEIKRTARSR